MITHNDSDHAGGLPSIVKLPSLTIGTIFLLLDRDKTDNQFQKIFRAVQEEESRGRFEVLRLEKDRQIWENDKKTLEIYVIYPSFSENLDAMRPNQTSAILCLRQGKSLGIIWPGDAPMQVLAVKCGGFSPSVLSGPHHGGPVDRNRKEFSQWVADTHAERMYVSVGTKGNHGLPAPKYLLQRVEMGCHVICSQLTKHCDNERVNKEMPILQTAALLGLRPPRSGVPCRGCYRTIVTEKETIPDAYDTEHGDRLATLRRPKCLGKK